jgi:hypothetical protein
MSSPIRDDGDLDPILRYAPPQVREQGQPPPKPPAPPIDRPGWRQSADSPEISGDRAMVEMRHRLTLRVGDARPKKKSRPRSGLKV